MSYSKSSMKGIRKSAFDLSHEKKMSLNMGDLVPFLLEEVVPGDKFKVNAEVLMRLAPMISPVMHRVNVYTHYFFVPNRLVWNEWEDFITGGPNGTLTPTFPMMTITDSWKNKFYKGGLPDYMGIPITDPSTTVTEGLNISSLPFRGYQMIYNEFYRDQNLSDPIAFSKGSTLDGGDRERLTTMRKRAYEKDYFTSCLPWAQRGEPVTIPLEGTATSSAINYKTGFLAKDSLDQGIVGDVISAAGGAIRVNDGSNVHAVDWQNIDSVESILDSSTVTINDLRTSEKLQRWLEKNAKGGARYIEQIWSHFQKKSSDARLQRPEYLGGGKNPVVISEVLQTSATATDGAVDVDTPQGNMAGRGISVGSNNAFTKEFEEHGYIIGIMSVLPRTAYQQGVDRTFTRTSKEEYLWPEFANLGEQAVLNKELYHDYVTAGKDGTFGYQERYAEYKYKQSKVAGDFRDNLSYWHMGRIFDAMPALNESFVMSDDITHQIFAVTDPDVHKLYTQVYLNMKAIRPLPKHAIPSLI